MRRWQNWVALFGLIFFCGCGASILVPIFASARVAARDTTVLKQGTLLAQTLAGFVDRPTGRLPDKDWKSQVERANAGLIGKLSWQGDGWRCGFAAVPGTLGKKLDALPPETVLYVEYSAADDMTVLEDVFGIGKARRGRAVAITANGLMTGGHARFGSSNEIAYLLGRQGATFKDGFGNL